MAPLPSPGLYAATSIRHLSHAPHPVSLLSRRHRCLRPPTLRVQPFEEEYRKESDQDLDYDDLAVVVDEAPPRPPLAGGRRGHGGGALGLVLPLLAHLEEVLGVVGDDGVDALPDAPLHPLLVVDRPQVDVALGLARGAQERRAARPDQHLLQQVEVDAGLLEEARRVQQGGPDVRDREAGEVLLADVDVVLLAETVSVPVTTQT